MTTKEIDSALEKFNIAEHGDRNEQLLWGFIGAEFPNYEVFWRRYIVPLTHRLDTSLPEKERIRLRPGFKDFELFAMAHYSVFYFFGHARRRFESRHDEELLAHDVFYLLDSSLDNLKTFYEQLQDKIAKLTDATFDRLVEPKKDKECPDLETISSYRDTLLHNPVPGRSIDRGVEKIARREYLDKVKESWSESEKLTDGELIETRKVLEDLRASYGRYLNAKWEKILFRREKYLRRMNLQTFMIHYDDFVPTTCAGPGASGTNDWGEARSNTGPIRSLSV